MLLLFIDLLAMNLTSNPLNLKKCSFPLSKVVGCSSEESTKPTSLLKENTTIFEDLYNLQNQLSSLQILETENEIDEWIRYIETTEYRRPLTTKEREKITQTYCILQRNIQSN